jgi:hypothetical protein
VNKDKARNTWRAMVMKERRDSDMARTREIRKVDKHYRGTGGGPPMPPVPGTYSYSTGLSIINSIKYL